MIPSKDEDGKVDKDLMYKVFSEVKAAAERGRFRDLKIKKAGRFRGGKSANVVEVCFGTAEETFLAKNEQGRLDSAGTRARLEQAMGLVDFVHEEAVRLRDETVAGGS